MQTIDLVTKQNLKDELTLIKYYLGFLGTGIIIIIAGIIVLILRTS